MKNHTQFSKNPFAFIPAEIQKGWPHNRHCCFCLVAPKSLFSLSAEKSKKSNYQNAFRVTHLEIQPAAKKEKKLV